MEFTVLAKSKKYNNYCVAGKDEIGNWVRLTSDDATIHNAVNSERFRYRDGSEIELGDIVEVDVSTVIEQDMFQPENVRLNRYKFRKIGQIDTNSIQEDYYSDVLFSRANRISEDELVCCNNIRSLQLVKPEVFIIKIKDTEKRSLRANFFYRGCWYNDFSITDLAFTSKYYKRVFQTEKKELELNNIKMTISLGELFHGMHYKLIAAVFEPNWKRLEFAENSYSAEGIEILGAQFGVTDILAELDDLEDEDDEFF